MGLLNEDLFKKVVAHVATYQSTPLSAAIMSKQSFIMQQNKQLENGVGMPLLLNKPIFILFPSSFLVFIKSILPKHTYICCTLSSSSSYFWEFYFNLVVQNKYFSLCTKADSCFINWAGTSSSMESNLLEGFLTIKKQYDVYLSILLETMIVLFIQH